MNHLDNADSGVMGVFMRLTSPQILTEVIAIACAGLIALAGAQIVKAWDKRNSAAERPEGWQRAWTRVEMKTTAEPSYLAVWVQGPGVVWVDDLSLREVVEPPLRLSLDQSDYDALDRIAVGMFTVGKRVNPAQVRLSLATAEGKTLEERTVPVGTPPAQESTWGRLVLATPLAPGACQMMFDPSALKPGTYACRVALLNKEGKTIAEQKAAFERIGELR